MGLVLNKEDKIEIIDIEFGRDRFDCKEPKNKSLCESDTVKERITYYREKFGWQTRVKKALGEAKNPKEHLKPLPFDKSRFRLVAVLQKCDDGKDCCGKDFCHINIVAREKSRDGCLNDDVDFGVSDCVIARYVKGDILAPVGTGNIFLEYKNNLDENVYLTLSETNVVLSFWYPLGKKYDCNDSQNKEACGEAWSILRFFRDNADWDEIIKQKIKDNEIMEDPLKHL